MPLHIDSGSCNSQARGGLSPASSLHFLNLRERETARDWGGDNVSRQKSIFCSYPFTLSRSIILCDAKCLLWQQRGKSCRRKRPKQAKIGSNFDFGKFIRRPSNIFSPMSIGKLKKAAGFYSKVQRITTQSSDGCKQAPDLPFFFRTIYFNKASKLNVAAFQNNQFWSKTLSAMQHRLSVPSKTVV